jgi:hypothetical protein
MFAPGISPQDKKVEWLPESHHSVLQISRTKEPKVLCRL